MQDLRVEAIDRGLLMFIESYSQNSSQSKVRSTISLAAQFLFQRVRMWTTDIYT